MTADFDKVRSMAIRLRSVEALLAYVADSAAIDALFASSPTREHAVAALQRLPFDLPPEAALHLADCPLWSRTGEGRAELEAERDDLVRRIADAGGESGDA